MASSSPKALFDPLEAARLYLAGHAYEAVAVMLKVSPSRVYKALVRQGVKRRRAGYPAGIRGTGKLRSEEVARQYLAGHTMQAIAAMLKMSPSAVHHALLRQGVKRRPPGHGLALYREDLHADLRAGGLPTLCAIARKYGLSREAVRLHARAIGVTRYTLQSRAEAARERQRQRQLARDAADAARRAEKEAFRRRVAALWQRGAPCGEIARVLGLASHRRANELIIDLRSRYPAEFPNRPPTGRVPGSNSPKQLARLEARRDLLARVWKTCATHAEAACCLGLKMGNYYSQLRRYRRHFPAYFPPRDWPSTPANFCAPISLKEPAGKDCMRI